MCGTHPKSSTGSSVLKDLSHTNNVYSYCYCFQTATECFYQTIPLQHIVYKEDLLLLLLLQYYSSVFCHCALCVCVLGVYTFTLYKYNLTLFKNKTKTVFYFGYLQIVVHQDCRIWQYHPTILLLYLLPSTTYLIGSRTT